MTCWKRFLFLSIGLMMAATLSFAQNPPHPNGGNDPGAGNTPVGGGAPVGGSFIIMLTLGLGYTAKRVYHMRRSVQE